MNNFIKHFSSRLTLQNTSISLVKVTSRFSPIVMTTLQLTLMLTVMMIALPSLAVQADNASEIANGTNPKVIQSYSSGQIVNSSDKTSQEDVLKHIKQRVILGDSDQKLNKVLNGTRDDVISKKYQQVRKITKRTARNITTIPSLSNTSRSFSDGTFAIYEGYSQLIEDIDEDGYYQTFSVTFDADLITGYAHDEAVVYAELYLSENGGPWVHYYSTDNFVIHGESSDDEFEVYSTLEQGFSANQYDILIDLYEDGYPDIIASYSSDDSNSLYGLPLESSDYDVEYVEYYEEVHTHGGSSSVILLILVGIMIFSRRNKHHKNTCYQY
ncbi:choice-of-anchor H family protein [Colwellia sp. 75C3]|uniref:choice-of-anchor H family protein n=1 Tax=Colwellia sp. 75C3 TaxID=888425 RepID=UPI001E31FC0F|nr:choice-of-anchor H family protein [Colwellia sp. 75C3]